jgi:hypothetical protein
MHCPNCGTKNSARAKFCVNCGEELPVLKKGKAAASAPTAPAVQQIVIREKTNWINLILGILLLAVIFCVGSVYLMSATDTSAASLQEMLAEPRLYFEGLGRLSERLVENAQVAIANFGDGVDDAAGGQDMVVNNNLCAATFYQPPTFQADNWQPSDTLNFKVSLPVLFGGVDNPMTNAIDNYPPNTPMDEWMMANDLEPLDLANSVQVDIAGTQFQYCNVDQEGGEYFGYTGDPDVPYSENYEQGIYLTCAATANRAITSNEIADVKLYAFGCSQPLAIDQMTIPAGGDANAAGSQQGGTGGNADICAETFYQPPTFQAINWLPADTLNLSVSLPVLFGGEDNPQTNAIDIYPPNTPLDEWMLSNNLELGDLADAVQVNVSGTQFQYCNLDEEGGGSFNYDGDPEIPYSDGYMQGIYLNCSVTTDREITDYELANVELYAFGCQLPLAIDQFSIPPKELEAYEPPATEEVSCEKGEHLNQKGKCVPDNACNAGDVYASSEGVCCAPSDYDATWDSCNPPFYTP